MAIRVHVIKFHISNVINRPPHQKALGPRAIKSRFQGNLMEFLKYMCTKIPGMLQQGLLAPQGLFYLLLFINNFNVI